MRVVPHFRVGNDEVTIDVSSDKSFFINEGQTYYVACGANRIARGACMLFLWDGVPVNAVE